MSFKDFKTERMLLASIAVLFLFLFANAFTKGIVGTYVSFAEEGSGTSGSGNEEDSQNDGESEDGEDSQDDEDSQDENSEEVETSEPSVSSTSSVRTTQTTDVNTAEVSEKSSDETSQQSQSVGTEQASEASASVQEVSEESIKYVDGYGEVISREGNVALVKQDEKLFFLIPVEVESQVTLDEQGAVVDAKKSFVNWLLSVLSF